MGRPPQIGKRAYNLTLAAARLTGSVRQTKMNFLSALFDKGEKPQATFEDPELGRMEWSKDDEAWIGTHAGLQYALAYERKASPAPELLGYAKEMLADRVWLNATLEEEKRKAASNAPATMLSEIETLKFGLIHFYRHKNRRRIIADVEGGGDRRSWRIEYHDRECEGMGFDT